MFCLIPILGPIGYVLFFLFISIVLTLLFKKASKKWDENISIPNRDVYAEIRDRIVFPLIEKGFLFAGGLDIIPSNKKIKEAKLINSDEEEYLHVVNNVKKLFVAWQEKEKEICAKPRFRLKSSRKRFKKNWSESKVHYYQTVPPVDKVSIELFCRDCFSKPFSTGYRHDDLSSIEKEKVEKMIADLAFLENVPADEFLFFVHVKNYFKNKEMARGIIHFDVYKISKPVI